MTTTAPRSTGSPAVTESRESARRRSSALRRRAVPFWLAIPAIVIYLLVMIYPTIAGGVYAFTDWSGGKTANFVGFDNFVRLFADPVAMASIWNTLAVTISLVIFQTGIALLLALGLQARLRTSGILRTIFFLPFILPSLIVGVLWQFVYTPGGPLDTVLESVGLGSWIQLWLGNPNNALIFVIVALIWQNVGFSMVIYLAGLEQIPVELYEAASLDGAGAVRTFWSVTRPLLAPATTINITLTLVGSLKIFDQIFVMTGGGPGYVTTTLSLVTYKQSFVLGNYGYGSAIALVLTIIVAAAAFLQMWLRGRTDAR